ncbi:hypothetical protein HpBGD68_15080 [Helicobacter pylori]
MFDKKLSSNDWHIQKVEMNHQVYDIETMLADGAFRAVSYTNTTLPTIYPVFNPWAAATLKKKQKQHKHTAPT